MSESTVYYILTRLAAEILRTGADRPGLVRELLRLRDDLRGQIDPVEGGQIAAGLLAAARAETTREPRVWLPGDTVPAGTRTVTAEGHVRAPVNFPYPAAATPLVEVHVPDHAAAVAHENMTRDAARWAFEERGELLTAPETQALHVELDAARAEVERLRTNYNHVVDVAEIAGRHGEAIHKALDMSTEAETEAVVARILTMRAEIEQLRSHGQAVANAKTSQQLDGAIDKLRVVLEPVAAEIVEADTPTPGDRSTPVPTITRSPR